MNSEISKKIILIVFWISLLSIFYIGLKDSLKKIKMEYINNQTIEIIASQHRPEDDNRLEKLDVEYIDISKEISDPNKEEPLIGDWRALERKDSYNNELQFYTIDNVSINGDIIEITSKEETREDKIYTSGFVESTNMYKYGYFEFNIQISEGKGLFPAIWFLPSDGDALPEIDLFEMIGSEPCIFYGVIHFEKDGVQGYNHFLHKVPTKQEYYVSLQWEMESLTWYIDNQEIYTTTKGVPKEYMYIIINQAIGGNWPGSPDNSTIFPNHFKVISTQIDPVFKEGRD